MSLEPLVNQISQPIELATEKWLLDRAHAAGVDAAVAANGLTQLEIGKHVAELRREGDFFTTKEAGSLVFDLANGTQVGLSSDMLFELLLFAAPSEPRLAPLLCGALGLFPKDRGLLAQPPRTTADMMKDVELDRLKPATQQQTDIARLVAGIVAAAG